MQLVQGRWTNIRKPAARNDADYAFSTDSLCFSMQSEQQQSEIISFDWANATAPVHLFTFLRKCTKAKKNYDSVFNVTRWEIATHKASRHFQLQSVNISWHLSAQKPHHKTLVQWNCVASNLDGNILCQSTNTYHRYKAPINECAKTVGCFNRSQKAQCCVCVAIPKCINGTPICNNKLPSLKLYLFLPL